MFRIALAIAIVALAAGTSEAQPASAGCSSLPSHGTLKAALDKATAEEKSGLNNHMWATIVDRDGVVCAVAFSGTDRASQWGASRVISAQKASTASLARARFDIELGRVGPGRRPRLVDGESVLRRAARRKLVRLAGKQSGERGSPRTPVLTRATERRKIRW